MKFNLKHNWGNEMSTAETIVWALNIKYINNLRKLGCILFTLIRVTETHKAFLSATPEQCKVVGRLFKDFLSSWSCPGP